MTNRKSLLDRQMSDIDFRADVMLAGLALDLAERLEQLRITHGMSQAQLAEKMNVKQSQISRYENTATASFTLKTLAKLADALDCDLAIGLNQKEHVVNTATAPTVTNQVKVDNPEISDFKDSIGALLAGQTTGAANNVIKFPRRSLPAVV